MLLWRIIKILLWLTAILAALYSYLIWQSRATYPVSFGVSFSPEYAEQLGLDPRAVYQSTLEELQPQYIRLAAMWKDVEAVKYQYAFDDIDWYMDLAAEHGTKVVLVVGQKAPRWPECHVPLWLDTASTEAKGELLAYVRATVEHYKAHPALEFWQVENEPYIHFTFGECEGFMPDAVAEEIALVRELDPAHPVLVTDSGELGLWRKAAKAGDYFGTTLYRIVRTPAGTVISHDWLPPAFYRLKAKVLGITLEKSFVAELQGEPWFHSGTPNNTAIDVQEETMNPDRLMLHIDYVRRIGMPRAYLWGVEWWYFMRETHQDARYWEVAKQTFLQGRE